MLSPSLFVTGLVLGGQLIHQSTIVQSQAQGAPRTNPDVIHLFIDGPRVKWLSDQRKTTVWYQERTALTCVESGNCYRKEGLAVLSAIQLGLPIDGIAKYTRFTLSPRGKTRLVSAVPCEMRDFEYELGVDVAGLISAKARGKGNGCFSRHIRFAPVDDASLARVAAPAALAGIRELTRLGFAIEIDQSVELEHRLLGREKREAFSVQSRTGGIVEWRAPAGFFDPRAAGRVIDLTDIHKNLGGLIQLLSSR